MNNYRVGDFDKEIKQISCLKLKKSHYDTTRQLVFYKDRIYVMGYTIAGASVLIYDLVGNFIKEIRLPDAIAVNSMTANSSRNTNRTASSSRKSVYHSPVPDYIRPATTNI